MKNQRADNQEPDQVEHYGGAQNPPHGSIRNSDPCVKCGNKGGFLRCCGVFYLTGFFLEVLQSKRGETGGKCKRAEVNVEYLNLKVKRTL